MAFITILPPPGLYHPVLPHRQGGKLTFPLCAACVKQEVPKSLHERTSICSHTDQERALTGTWCTPEIVKALSVGYQMIRIHEVWHFQTSKKGLFSNYVRQWLKVKQESAGYPDWADTPQKQQQYREAYLARENIELDPDLITPNPGRKATAKLMLNSFWGKFGENLDKSQVTAVSTPAQLFDMVEVQPIQIQQIRICNSDLLEVVHKQPPEEILDNGKRNIFVASFTTCHARLKLYESLETLQEQVLYFDTDSVIYSHKAGQPKIELGDFLDDMTDELRGDTITEFVSGGPKNYGYTTAAGKLCCKVRGFTLNVRGSRQLNYDIMKRNVLAEIDDPLDEPRTTDVVNPHFFTRNPATKRIKVIPRTKRYALVFDKRVLKPATYQTLPYGYQKLDDSDDANIQALMEL